MCQNDQIQYLLNRSWLEVTRTFKLTIDPKFLLVFNIIYTHHTTGSTIFGPKKNQKGPRCPNSIYPEPFVVKGWWIPQNNFSTLVFVTQAGDNWCIMNNLTIIRGSKTSNG